MKKNINLKFNLFVAVFLSSVCAIAATGGHGEIPFENIRNQAINLGILLAALIYFIRAPLKASFKAKKDQFLEESEKTAAALKLAEQELLDVKQRLHELESGEKEAVLNAEKEARELAEKIITESQAQGKKIVEDINLIVAAEVVKAKNQIREQIINKSLQSAEANIKSSS